MSVRVCGNGQVTVGVMGKRGGVSVAVGAAGEASQGIVGTGDGVAVRVGLGDQVASAVVGVGGRSSGPVGQGQEVVDGVVGVMGLISHPVGDGGLVAVAVVGVFFYIAQRVGFGQEFSGLGVGIGVRVSQRRGLTGDVAFFVVGEGAGVSFRVRHADDIAFVVAGVGGHISQHVPAGRQMAGFVVGVDGGPAVGVGRPGQVARGVISAGEHGAVFLNRLFDQSHGRIGVFGSGPVGMVRYGRVRVFSFVSVGGGIAVSVGFGDQAAVFVVFICLRPGVVGEGGDAEPVVVLNGLSVAAFFAVGVGPAAGVVGVRHEAAVRHALFDDLVVFVVGILKDRVSVQVRDFRHAVIAVVGVSEGISVWIGRGYEGASFVRQGQGAPGAVGDGAYVAAVPGEAEAAGTAAYFGQFSAAVGQGDHVSVRLHDPGRLSVSVKVYGLPVVMGHDVAVFIAVHVPCDAFVGPQGAVVFHEERHMAAVRQIHVHVVVEGLYPVVIVVAPAVSKAGIIQIVHGGQVGSGKGQGIFPVQGQVRVGPAEPSGQQVHRVAARAHLQCWVSTGKAREIDHVPEYRRQHILRRQGPAFAASGDGERDVHRLQGLGSALDADGIVARLQILDVSAGRIADLAFPDHEVVKDGLVSRRTGGYAEISLNVEVVRQVFFRHPAVRQGGSVRLDGVLRQSGIFRRSGGVRFRCRALMGLRIRSRISIRFCIRFYIFFFAGLRLCGGIGFRRVYLHGRGEPFQEFCRVSAGADQRRSRGSCFRGFRRFCSRPFFFRLCVFTLIRSPGLRSLS